MNDYSSFENLPLSLRIRAYKKYIRVDRRLARFDDEFKKAKLLKKISLGLIVLSIIQRVEGAEDKAKRRIRQNAVRDYELLQTHNTIEL